MPDYKVKFETVFHVEAATEADAQEGAHQALLAGQCGLQPAFTIELQSEGNASSPSPIEPVLGADTADSETVSDSSSAGVTQNHPAPEQGNAAPAESAGDAQTGAATESDAGGESEK